MGEKEDKLRQKIDRKQGEDKRERIDEGGGRESSRDIEKMQAPDKWPSPPEDNKESDGKE